MKISAVNINPILFEKKFSQFFSKYIQKRFELKNKGYSEW